jgi:hypothetical protein
MSKRPLKCRSTFLGRSTESEGIRGEGAGILDKDSIGAAQSHNIFSGIIDRLLELTIDPIGGPAEHDGLARLCARQKKSPQELERIISAGR